MRWISGFILLTVFAACGGESGGADVHTGQDTKDVVDVIAQDLSDSGPDAQPEVAADVPPETVDAWTGFQPLEALVSCGATAPVCDSPEPDDGIYSSYRKDHYADPELYQTEHEIPIDGGRFHIAGVSAASGQITGFFINDQPVEDLLADLKMDWRHVWPEQAVAGAPIWFAFHSRDPAWDEVTEGTIRIETDGGVALEGTFTVGTHPVLITFVTLDADRENLVIHVQNTSEAEQTVTGIRLDGRNLLGTQGICVPDPVLKPGQMVLWTIPLCQAPPPGSAWILALDFEDLPSTAAVGRHLRPFFPIEAWQKGSDCPLPGGEAHDLFTAGGLDTFYIYWGAWDKCGYDNATMFNETLPGSGTYALLGDDFPWDDPPVDVLTDTSAIAGVLTGDESDWDYVTDEGAPKPETKATRARKVWRAFPELTVYNGAMTSKHIGAFAGMTDVQGIDIYAAGCPPHLLEWGVGPPLRAPYDFLRNARNNHMPWPTWLYSQGMGEWPLIPDPQEVTVQGFMALAAGGKGLMWFQVGTKYLPEHKDTWEAIADVNWMIRAVRGWLREGDITGLARSGEDTIVEAIRARDAIVVPLISIESSTRPTDEECFLYVMGQVEEEPHWLITDRLLELEVDIPEDMAITDIFEVRADQVVDVNWPMKIEGRTLTIRDIPMNNDTPARLFVLATGPEARAKAEAVLQNR